MEEKLRDRFKFLTRERNPGRPGSMEPPSKRPRNDEQYEENVVELQGEMLKRKKDRSVTTIQSLTESTFLGRRNKAPPVFEIIEKFPSLKIRQVVC